MGKEPLEKLEIAAQRLARRIDDMVPEGMGFVVVIADTETTGGHMTYVSNLQREGSMRMLMELLEKWVEGGHEV